MLLAQPGLIKVVVQPRALSSMLGTREKASQLPSASTLMPFVFTCKHPWLLYHDTEKTEAALLSTVHGMVG